MPKTPSLPLGDKVAHAILYAGLAAVVSLGIRCSNDGVHLAVQIVIPILFATLYGITDEIHQIFVPRRSCDFMDVIADFAGATLMQCALCWWFVRLDAQSQQSEDPDMVC